MTSDARNNQTPNLPLCRPVSGRASTVYGIFISGQTLHHGGHGGHGGSDLRCSDLLCSAVILRVLCVLCVLCGSYFYALSGSNCGVKSFAAPGTLYSYGPRYTIGSVTKLPCPGGDGAAHSSVVASHGLRSTAFPHLMLEKKFTMNGSWNSPRPHAAKPITRFNFSGSSGKPYNVTL